MMEEWKSERDFVSRYLYPKIDEAVGARLKVIKDVPG